MQLITKLFDRERAIKRRGLMHSLLLRGHEWGGGGGVLEGSSSLSCDTQHCDDSTV